MPVQNFILMLMIGVIFGAIAGVVLRGKRGVFVVNVLLGVIGASLGAFFPVLIGNAVSIDVSNHGYLLRALLGSFLLVVLASLFRSAKVHIK